MTTTPVSMTTPASPAAAAAAATSPAATSPAATAAATGAASALGSLGSDTFLKLLVAQLRYQDPMNPADSTQMMAQTAQFSQVEKLTNMDATLTADLAAHQNAEAASLIGDQVTMAGGPNGTDVTGVVTGMRVTADGPVLSVAGQQINLSQLRSVQGPATTPTTTSTPAA
jgi:flagellar basal-body rod modification protein FlgD